MRPPEDHLDLLERPLFAAFATTADDCSPRVVPMWFLWDAEQNLVLLTHVTTRNNYRFVRRQPKVALMIFDPDKPYRYLQVRGEVEAIEPDPEGTFYNVLQQRYRGRTGEVRDRDVRVRIAIRPTGFRTF